MKYFLRVISLLCFLSLFGNGVHASFFNMNSDNINSEGGQTFPSFFPSVSHEDKDFIQGLINDADTIQGHVRTQLTNPDTPTSDSYLTLNPSVQYGAQEAVSFLQEMHGLDFGGMQSNVTPNESDAPLISEEEVRHESSSESEEENSDVLESPPPLKRSDQKAESPFDPDKDRSLYGHASCDVWNDLLAQEKISQDDSLLLDYVYGGQRGRSLESGFIPKRHKSYSPPRIRETFYEVGIDHFKEGFLSCYRAQDRLSIDNFNPDDVLPALGAYAIDGLILINEAIDDTTFGLWSKISTALEEGAQHARTYVRRSSRFILNDQRVSQNLGDGVYVVLSCFGGKGIKQIRALQKTGAEVKNLSRVQKINNRMPINYEYAGKVYPLEKLPRSLQMKYPHSVPFTGTGHPDFTRYAKAKVDIKMTGERYLDDKLANIKMGFKVTPTDFTWHHHQNGTTMQLVPRDIHEAIRHTGGSAIIKGKSLT